MCCVFLGAVCHVLLPFFIYGVCVCITDIFIIQQYQQAFDLWNEMYVCMQMCWSKILFLVQIVETSCQPTQASYAKDTMGLFYQTYTTWDAQLTNDVHVLGLQMNVAYTSLPPIWLNDITLPDNM
jgi:hypothetical protein